MTWLLARQSPGIEAWQLFLLKEPDSQGAEPQAVQYDLLSRDTQRRQSCGDEKQRLGDKAAVKSWGETISSERRATNEEALPRQRPIAIHRGASRAAASFHHAEHVATIS